MRKKIILLGLIIIMIGMTGSIFYGKPKKMVYDDAKMKWWKEARYGMFIHWGLYAILGGEWQGKIPKMSLSEHIMRVAKIPLSDYESLTKQFNPVKFNADEWVRLAKEAGMKYMVITSKHHDGFAMYHSKVSKYNIYDATPFKRDPVRELMNACKKYGLKFGVYYSQAQDWHAPGGYTGRRWDERQDGDWEDYVDKKVIPQLKELLKNYPYISIIWFDSARKVGSIEGAERIYQAIKKIKPNIIINNRLSPKHDGDYKVAEQFIPAGQMSKYWETCMTINGTWGYSKHDKNWKSTKVLLQKLVDIVSKGGNFLLNVGPKPDGTIPKETVVRLKEIGKWIKKNGDSIYGTDASPFKKLEWGRCTIKKKDKNTILYLHIFEFPKNKKLVVPGVLSKVEKAYLLANKKKLKYIRKGEKVIVYLPSKNIDKYDTVVVLEVKKPLKINKYLPSPDKNGVVYLDAKDADIHNGTKRPHAYYDKKTGIVKDWGPATKVSWLFNLKNSGKYRVYIKYSSKEGNCKVRTSPGMRPKDFNLPSTGGLNKFREKELGVVRFKNAGENTILFIPTKEPKKKGKRKRLSIWTLIYVKSCKLVPVE